MRTADMKFVIDQMRILNETIAIQSARIDALYLMVQKLQWAKLVDGVYGAKK